MSVILEACSGIFYSMTDGAIHSISSGGVDYDQFEFVTMTISLTFGDGIDKRRKRSVSGPYCFDVTFLPDDLVEFDETFELQLSTDDIDIALFPNTTTITILNNDCKLATASQVL